MLQILSHTPRWVFVLFVALIVFGLQQARNRNVKQFLAYLLPLVMVALSLAGVISSFGIKVISIGLWAVGLAIVTVIGYKLFPVKGITYHSEQKYFFMPGSWLPFVVIMTIFFTKYTVSVLNALNSNLLSNPLFILMVSLAYGCFSGYFAARAVNLIAAQKQH
jgi:hypothetical protein